mgnify:CR=1 FL=1
MKFGIDIVNQFLLQKMVLVHMISLHQIKKIHDDYRIKYLKEHIDQIGKCIDEGIPVIGYTSWGCIDIVSAGTSERSNVTVIYM